LSYQSYDFELNLGFNIMKSSEIFLVFQVSRVK